MAKKKRNEDKKLHNSHELDLSWQETVDLRPEDENEDGSEICYFVDQDGNIHSREFLSEELIPNVASARRPLPAERLPGKQLLSRLAL